MKSSRRDNIQFRQLIFTFISHLARSHVHLARFLSLMVISIVQNVHDHFFGPQEACFQNTMIALEIPIIYSIMWYVLQH